MGGGSYLPGEASDPYGGSAYQPSASKHSVSARKSSLGRQDHGNMSRDFREECMVARVGRRRGHRRGQNLDHHDMELSARSLPGDAHGGGGAEPRVTADQIDEMHQYDKLFEHNRNHGTDLATLRKKSAALDAHLQAPCRMPSITMTRERAQAIVYYLEIENDIVSLEDGVPLDGSRRDMVFETDITPILRDLSRIRVEALGSSNIARRMGPPSRHHDQMDYAGGIPNYQPRGSRSGHHPPAAVHSRSAGHRAIHEMGPASHHVDDEYYAAMASNCQPHGPRHGRHLPPAGHGHHSGRRAGRLSDR